MRAEAAESWADAKARAAREHKALVVFFRPADCRPCDAFERTALAHPIIVRRLERIVLARRFERTPSIAVFDHGGTLRARWDKFPPSTVQLGQILDSAIAAAPHFERAIELSKQAPHEGDLHLGLGLSRLDQDRAAREAIERAIARGSPKTRQLATVGRAMLDIAAGQRDAVLTTLHDLIRQAVSPEVAATAWMGVGLAHRLSERMEESITAYETAANLEGADPATRSAAAAVARRLRESLENTGGPIHLVSPGNAVLTGRQKIRTVVQSAAVHRVEFALDGELRATVAEPPFSATIDLGPIPQPRTLRAIAFDAQGRELGRAQLVVNDAGETFWIRLAEPREGRASGKVRVTATLRAPAAHRIQRVVVSWNDVERAVINAPPWQADVDVPGGEIGVLRAVAELDDGRNAEDAVLLNAPGFTEHSDVPLVELPVTIKGGPVSPAEVVVREGDVRRAVESVTSGAEAPLTVGVVIDTSSSMLQTLPDVQEAAIRFVESALGTNDRAFLIAFDSVARVVEKPTGDVARLREQILGLRPGGHTSLYDAMILGLLQFEGVKGRRALVVFSDGMDTRSRYHNGDVAELARRSNIPLYVIAAAPHSTTQWVLLVSQLTRVSESTGGLTHRLSDLGKLGAVYAQIEADLRAQSLVVIRTDAGKSEKDWRKIEVSVPGRPRVRAPEGYYAPW